MKKYRFCSYCGHKLTVKYLEAEGRPRESCPACQEVFYQNSKPGVGALIIKGNEILLAKRTKAPYRGYWDIPGGFLEAGEHPLDGLRREIKEETGLKIKPGKILGIFMDKYGSEKWDTLNIFYIVEIVSGKMQAKSDVSELKWFSKKSLPKKIAFCGSRQALKIWRHM